MKNPPAAWIPPWLVGGLLVLIGSAPAAAQVTIDDYKRLRINEILASNDTVLPQNCRCRHSDMIEIFNGSDKDLALDNTTLGTVRLTDNSLDPFSCTDPSDPTTCRKRYLTFRNHPVRNILRGERIVIFAGGLTDCDDRDDACDLARSAIDIGEIHTPFSLDRDGETITLELLPRESGAAPIILDEIRYPPLREDVSYGRFPDGADNWVFSSTPTFGECRKPAAAGRPSCRGTENGPGNPIPPDIDLLDYESNSPDPGKPVLFRARVADEKGPGEPNIAGVEIRYRVDGGDERQEGMALKGVEIDPFNDLHTWSVWEGSIPGQPAGSVVEFHLWARDADGMEATDPGTLCPPGVGPCDAKDVPPDLGPGCAAGQSCRTPFRYTVGSTYSGPLVINECVPNNESILEDITDRPCDLLNLACKFDDFIEIHNASDDEVLLEGLWLSEKPFRPDDGWQFPAGSRIGPRQFLIVWVDNDGKDPVETDDPPNPNDPSKQEFHTSFGINGGGDEIFLYDTAENRFQVIDGVRWGMDELVDSDPRRGLSVHIQPDDSLVRCPEPARDTRWTLVARDFATPAAPNHCGEVVFRRGDAGQVPDGAIDISDAVQILGFLFLGEGPPACPDAADTDDSGSIDITDAVSLLGHLFLGDPPPPAPGKDACGADPTPDALGDCRYPPVNCG